MPTKEATLITEAKRLQRLQTKRRKLRKELKLVEDEMRLVRKNLRGLSSSKLDDDVETPDDQLPAEWKGKIQ